MVPTTSPTQVNERRSVPSPKAVSLSEKAALHEARHDHAVLPGINAPVIVDSLD
jgi:hypothetical protein